MGLSACRALIITLAVSLLGLPAYGATQNLEVRSNTILRYFERDVNGHKDSQVLPAYEYLQVDYGDDKPWSFHAYGWMRVNLGDDFYEDNPEGSLLYGYAQYRPSDRDYLLRLGRQVLFEGVSNESVDGVWGRTDLKPYLSLSAYAGLPVTLDTSEGRKGDAVAGGRLSFHHLSRFDLGLSYKFIANDSDRDESLIGLDSSFDLPGDVLLSGLSTYNLVSGGWGEHSYEARFTLGPFELRPLFQQYQGEDFFNGRDNSANPFRFYSRLASRTTIIGSEAFWYPTENYEFALRLKHYDYEKRFGAAEFYSGIFTYKFRIHNQLGFELGRMEGDVAENRYTLSRGFFFFNLPPGFLTGDVVYVAYDQDIYNEDRSFFVSLGVGRKFLNETLNLKLSGDYSSDPYFDHDYRALLVADYYFRR